MSRRPRKRFGQNFLVDEHVIGRLVAAVAPKPCEIVVEIGPGREALTAPLLAAGVELTVVEIDRDLAASLRRRHPDLRVIEADALTVDFAALAQGEPYRLVGNLPYNISTPLLFHVLEQRPAPRDMHFMLQKEVVDRMTAVPGEKAYGRLTLACENLALVTPLFTVPPECFEPRPRVHSAFVRVVPRPEPLVPHDLRESFDTVVGHAFGQRRKTLRNSLRDVVHAEGFAAASIDPGTRAERLSLADFRRLAEQAAL